jgi:hypothetical protein
VHIAPAFSLAHQQLAGPGVHRFWSRKNPITYGLVFLKFDEKLISRSVMCYLVFQKKVQVR